MLNIKFFTDNGRYCSDSRNNQSVGEGRQLPLIEGSFDVQT
ncbi:hypothetical protein [Salipaludibacillus agaradhaerens]|nr:hypothetical protein [Salipaludibacillus agaradhaerens]